MKFLKFLYAHFIKCLWIPEVRDSAVSPKAKLCRGTSFKNSSIGKYSYVAPNTEIIHTKIGNFTSIAGDCLIGPGSHPVSWGSLSPVFCKGRNALDFHFSDHEYDSFRETEIGHDVWIGAKTVVIAGVKIGHGAVVATGAVVTKDIPPFEIWGGVPARFIRDRFPEDVKKMLLECSYWDWPDEKIRLLAADINDLERFLEKLKEMKVSGR